MNWKYGTEPADAKARRLAANLLRGAAASLGATTAMSVFFGVAHRMGLLGEPPPRKLTQKLFSFRPPAKEFKLNLATIGGHFGYGAAAGGIFGLLASSLERRRSRILAGAAFGTGLWAISYAGWIPAAGLMASPENDRPGRPTSMILAHVVFGAALGAFFKPQERSQLPADPVLSESEALDRALSDTFPASDPPSQTQPAPRRRPSSS